MRAYTVIPRHLEDRIDRELETGERIEWMDMPIPRYFTRASTAAFLFGIPWTAFAVFWVFAASGFKVPDFSGGGESLFPLFGLPFVLIGLAMLSSPFWAYRRAFKTVYVITDRRAILYQGGWTRTIRSYPPEKLEEIYRKERRDGSGDVVFDHRTWRGRHGREHTEELGFLSVRNPRQVEQMLKQLAQQSPAR